jgi:hypothetical protein
VDGDAAAAVAAAEDCSNVTPIRMLAWSRRLAVDRGEVRWFWPGIVWDVAALVWFRYLVGTVKRWWWGPGPDELYHSPSGGCPLCNPVRESQGL